MSPFYGMDSLKYFAEVVGIAFSYVMRNPAICTQLLEYLLPECKIARIKYIDWDTDETAEEECHMPKMRLAKPEMLVMAARST